MSLSILGNQSFVSFARNYGHLPFVQVKDFKVACRYFSLNTSSQCATSTYYNDLEITPQATSKQIKNAYFTLSKQYHPDVTANDEDLLKKFQAISEAYGILSNPKLRRAYDTGHLVHGSSVTSEEVWNHQFDQETFYDSRATHRIKAARGQKNLDDWIRKHRRETFHKNKHNIIKNKENVKNLYGSGGRAHHNRDTNNPVTDRIIANFCGYTFVIFMIINFLRRG